MKKFKIQIIAFFLLLSVSVSGCLIAKPPTEANPIIPQENENITPTPIPDTTDIPDVDEVTDEDTVTDEPDEVFVNPKKDVKAKGLYLTGWTAGDPKKLDAYIELANTTVINAYVIDVKNDLGEISYESNVPKAIEAGASLRKYDPEKTINALHDNDIYVIGRVVCFRDPIYSKKFPDNAIKHTDGGLWREAKKDYDLTWINPYIRENWDYLVDIAKEALEKGFDEIQFDYIRFPYGDRAKMDFGATDFVKHEVINEFISYARKQMPGAIISADVFGIICESAGDREDIGQYLELIGMELDYISPMAYPSLYALGQIVNGVKFPKPDLDPYGVVYNTMLRAKERIAQVEDYRADVRPFIQAFTASWLKSGDYQKYGAEQYRQQIKAVHDAGYEQWLLWDANNRYDFTAFDKN